MIAVLVDTSVWVDHFRRGNDKLAELLGQDQVMMHSLVLGEIACGTPPNRGRTLLDLDRLQRSQQASVQEVMAFVAREHLYGMGCGLIDLLLLASAMITPGVELWTLDKRLAALAEQFGVEYRPVRH